MLLLLLRTLGKNLNISLEVHVLFKIGIEYSLYLPVFCIATAEKYF